MQIAWSRENSSFVLNPERSEGSFSYHYFDHSVISTVVFQRNLSEEKPIKLKSLWYFGSTYVSPDGEVSTSAISVVSSDVSGGSSRRCSR